MREIYQTLAKEEKLETHYEWVLNAIPQKIQGCTTLKEAQELLGNVAQLETGIKQLEEKIPV